MTREGEAEREKGGGKEFLNVVPDEEHRSTDNRVRRIQYLDQGVTVASRIIHEMEPS